jgi:hypothetical protein
VRRGIECEKDRKGKFKLFNPLEKHCSKLKRKRQLLFFPEPRLVLISEKVTPIPTKLLTQQNCESCRGRVGDDTPLAASQTFSPDIVGCSRSFGVGIRLQAGDSLWAAALVTVSVGRRRLGGLDECLHLRSLSIGLSRFSGSGRSPFSHNSISIPPSIPHPTCPGNHAASPLEPCVAGRDGSGFSLIELVCPLSKTLLTIRI